IVTDPKQRGKGAASAAMREVTKALDAAGLTAYLEPAPIKALIAKGEKAMTRDQLVAWYERHGFTKVRPDSDLILRRTPEPVAAPAAPVTIGGKRAAIKAKRDALFKKLAQKAGELRTGVDPEMVGIMIDIVETYIEEGILVFKQVAQKFQEDFKPFG